jgi:hypothetical protein
MLLTAAANWAWLAQLARGQLAMIVRAGNG